MSAHRGDGGGEGPPRPSAQSTIVEAPSARRRERAGDEAGQESAGPVPVGAVLDTRYRLLELIGQGGMGAVYRARDLTLDADIAVKVLDREVAGNPKLVEYFRNEVRTARKVTHPNVCRLHDLVEADGLWLITMQHVDGSSLADRLRDDGVLPVAEALRILHDVAAGLAAAHAAGVVHRDLKPANILLAAGDHHALVADFGIAAEVNRLGVATMDVAGTRGYMSPEQAAGRPVDARTDVYAFGVLAHRMLTGQVPPTAPTRVGATDVGGPAAGMPADVPPGLIALIDQCLSGDPPVRPADGRVLVARLAALEERRDPTPRLVEVDPGERRAPAAPRGRRVAIAAVLLAAAAGAALTVWRPWRAAGDRPVRPPESAAELRIEPLVASDLAPEDAALPDSAVRLIIDELEDAWAMPARAAADGGPPPGPATARVTGRLFVERGRRLVLELEVGGAHQRFEAAGPRALAVDAARWLAETTVAPADRHPTAADRAAVCASSDESWRIWRRAQRESRMQRWGAVRELIARAVEIDPRFAMAYVELAFSYMRGDEAMARAYQKATETRCPTLAAQWKNTLAAAELVWKGEMEPANAIVDKVMADPALSERDRQYLATRWAFGLYFAGSRTEGVSRLEWIADQYPGDAAAPKLLANHFLEAGDAAAARRHAEKALAAAPYDLAVRADLARALLLAGDPEQARAHARIIDRADPLEKQRALAGSEDENALATLHIELGDLAEAERDARRLLLGSPTEKVQGGLVLGTIDLLRGAFPSGVDRVGAAADLAAENGVATVATTLRWRAIWAAYHSGELERARAQVGKLAGAQWTVTRDVMGSLIDHKAAPPLERPHHLAHARATAASLSGLLQLQLMAVVAHERGDWAGVLALEEKIAGATRMRGLTALYLTGDAHAARGELDEAAADFERLVGDPQAWKEPVLSGRAWRRLGEVRAARGDRAGAEKAFRTLVSRWTLAPAGDPDLAAARGGLERLNGSANGSTLPPE